MSTNPTASRISLVDPENAPQPIKETHCHQIATLTQARLIGGPVCQLAPLLRDMVATLGVGVEQHGGIRD